MNKPETYNGALITNSLIMTDELYTISLIAIADF